MKPVFTAPRSMLQRKPPHGAACNRCGLCCHASLCGLAQVVFRRPALPGPCPALRRRGDEHACGLAVDPGLFVPALAREHGTDALAEAAAYLIGAGDGCDARFNGEPRDETFAARLDAQDALNADRIAAARKLWRMP